MKNSSRVRRKSWERKLVTLAVASCFAADLYAAPPTPGLPYGPTVINGQVFFNYNGNLLQITNSSGAIINWQAFSIDSGAITRFIQQSASSTVLNRVTSGNPSTILGALQSQLPDGTTGGRVFLINPSGIVFGAGAQVDTGGLVASTLALSNADFLGGRNRFTEVNGAGAVENHGKITTPTGGSIYLIAPSIVNSGIIRSDGGEIVLAAGKSVELVNANSPDLRVTITAPDNQALNLGQIIAQGGKVGIYGGLIRQNGVVNANSAVRGENGKIVFKATKDVSLGAGSSTTASGPTGGSISIQSDTGKATVGGVVEANGTQGKGGTIAIAGQQGVAVEPTARVSANGIEGGSVALTSAAGAVSISAPVTANATLGRAGEVAVTAATTASLASTGQLSASGGQGNGIVSLKGSGGVTLDAGSQVQAKGATGGTVTVQADQGAIMAQGTIDASATEGTGGNVHVAAFSDIALDIGSKILASGRSGGEVKVESREGTLLASGLIDGQGNEGPGGLVWLLAPRVGLIRESVVNVSGLTGGGTVLVGGDYQGNNPDIQNASAVFFGPDSRIVADATQAGDGGRVILWSDDVTRAYGSISVRGGASSGNGGFVETSSHHFLDVTRAPDLAAPFGVGGTWLLDPENVNITNTINSNITAAPTFQPALAGSASNLQDLILRAALVAGGSVVVDTSVFGGGGGGAGNIDVQASAVLTGITAGVGTTLTLKAHNDISINSSITGAGGNALNITLTADQDVSGAGDVSVNAAINTNGGAFNATGVNFGNSTGGTITTGAGLINVNAKGSVALNDAITAGAGTITFLANQNAGANNFTMAAGSSITTANATSSAVAISVNAAGGGTGGAALRDITTGAAGTISVTTATGGNTTGGSITQPAGILTTGVGGSVVLSTPTGGGSSVGTGGANMRTASNIVTANAGSGGVFITETAGSDFTATATGAGDIQITALNGQLNILGDTSTGTGNITLNSVALNITQVGKLVGNVLTTNSVGGTVLNNAANAVLGFSATNATNGDVSLTNTLALDIAAAGITQNVGNLNITNTGAITQTGTISNAGGIATLAAGAANDINLGLGNNFGEVRVTTGKDVTLNDTNAISLGSVSTANNLTVSAVGIMQTASGLTVNGTSTFNGGAGVIALTTATNNLTGAVSLNNSGTNNVQIADANAIVLGASSVGQNLAVTAKGGISQTGALVVPGTSTFTVDTTAAQDVLLAGFDNNLTGAVTIATTGGATLQDVGLRNINGAAAVPTLPASLRNLDLQFTTAAVTLPTINLTGTLNVLAGGPITQAAGGVSVALTSTFNSGANAITLTDILNNFQGAVALTTLGAAGNIAITDANALVLGTVSMGNAGSTLAVVSNGAITQNGATTITSGTGAVSFNSGAAGNPITLTNNNDFRGAVALTSAGAAGNIAINDVNALVLGTVSMGNAASTLTVTTDGAITQNGATTITSGTGAVSFNSGAAGNPITLTNNNDFRGAVALTSAGAAGNIAINDVNALVLGTVSMGNAASTLTVTTDGAITQNGATTITSGTGLVNINSGATGSAIALTNNNDFRGAVRLTNVGANNIAITDANALVLDTVSMANAAGTLTVTTDGAITQNGATTITSGTGLVNINSGATGSAITLTNNNDFRGAVRLTSLGAAGNIAITDANALVLDTVSMGNAGSTLAVVSNGAITQNGATTITSGTGLVNINSGATGSAITLTNNNDFRGAVSLTNVGANNVQIADANAIVLGASSVGQNLAVTAKGGISQTGALVVPGTSTFTVDTTAAQDVLLAGFDNNLTGAVTIATTGGATLQDVGLRNINGAAAVPTLPASLRNLDLQFTTAAVTLPTINLTGTLNVLAGGPITQAAGGVSVALTSTFNSGANAITLTDILNNFQGAVALTTLGAAGNIAITDANALVLGTVSMGNAGSTLAVVSNGAITQNGATTITSGTGAVSFNSGAAGNPITLTNNNDFRGAVALTSAGAAGNIAINDVNALVLGTVSMGNAASTLTVTTDGAITQNGATTITSGTGAVSFNSGAAGNPITLTNNNDFRGAVALTSAGAAGNIAINDVNALVLGTVSMGNAASTLTVTTDGAITQNGATTITSGTGLVNINSGATGSAIALTNNNDFRGAVRLTNVGANNIAITDANALVLDTVSMANAAGTLTVTTDGAITQNGATTITSGTGLVNINSGATGSAITLTNNNDFRGAVRLTNVGANNIAITDANALVLDTVSMANAAGTLTVTTDGAITQNGATTITSGTGAVSFNSGAAGNPITLTNNNDFRGAVALTSAGAAGNIAINDVNALVLGTVSMGNAASTLTVTTDGAITQNGATTITSGTGLVNINSGATGSAIALTNNNDFRGAVRLTTVGANNIALTDANALVLDTVSMANAAGTLAVVSNGAITQNGATTITSGTGAVSFNSGAAGNPITLTNNNDFRGAVALTSAGAAGNIAINDANALVLGTVSMGNAASTLTVTTDGAITQNGATTITSGTGLVNINSGATGSAITLTNNNDFRGAVRLTNVGANNIAITDANALVLDTVSMANAAGTLTVTTDGAITQNGATTITSGTGLVNINSGATGSAITLTNTNDFRGAVRLTSLGAAGNIAITDANALLLDTVSMGNAASTLTVTTDGVITQNGATTITSGTGLVNINSGATGSAITLTNNNDFRGAVRLTNVGANNIAITDTNALVLDTVSMANAAGTLTVTTDGAITQNGATTITSGTGLVNINSGATGSAITLTNNNDFRGAVRLTSLGAAGNIAITDANALVLDTVSMGNAGSTLAVVSNGAITQNGATTITSGTGLVNINSGATGSAITLTNNNDFRGAVSLTNVGANNVQIADANAIVLGASSVGQNLAVTAKGGISQTGALVVPGTSTFTVDTTAAQDVLLAGFDNNLTGAVTIATTGGATLQDVGLRNINGAAAVPTLPASLRNLDLQFTTAAVTLPTINLTGTLNVLAGGPITQAAGGVSVALTSTFNSGANAITLTDILNNFQGAVALTTLGAAGNIAITDANALVLGTVSMGNAGSTLAVVSNGAITQNGATTITSGTGAVSFNSGAAGNPITLTNNNDFRGAVALTSAGAAGNIAINDVNALVLGTVSMGNAASTLTVTTDGAITQNGATTITSGTGLVNINSGATGSAITLTNNNDFRGAVRLTSVGAAGNIAITDANALQLDTVSMGNAASTLTVTTDGAITQNGATTITSGTGLVNINSGATGSTITLTNNNDFRGAVRLTNVGANNIAITDANALVLDTVSMANAAGTLTVTTDGAITQNGATTITSGTGLVNINSGATGSAITLTNNNDFRGAVRLTSLGAAGNIAITDANALVLDTVSMGNAASTLTVTTDGAITQNGATTITSGTGLVNINSGATGSAITLTNNNDFRGAVRLTNVGANNIAITDANALVLDTVSMANAAGTLTVTTDGAITQNGATTITSGTGLVNINSGATGSAITLTNNNDFRGAVRLTSVSAAGNIAITDANALQLDTVSMGNAGSTLAVVSNGAITQNGATTITSGTGAVSFNSGAAGNPITLTNNNDFRGAVALTSAGAAGNIAINDVNALVLGTVSMGNAASTLTVTTDGAITQNGATTITSGTGLVNINSGATGSAITLTNNNDFRGAVRLTNVGANNIAITDANALVLDTVSMANAAGTLTVTTDGAITQNGATTITSGTGLVNINSGATGSAITLTNNNDFRGAVALTSTGAAGNVSINDVNALTMGILSIGHNFTATSTGATTLNGALATGNGGTVTLTNGGLLTISANINADGAVTQNGLGLVDLNADITTTGDAVNFQRAVTLGGAGAARSIDTTNGGGNPFGGNITFQNTVAGGTKDFTLNAGTLGDLLHTGAITGVGNYTLNGSRAATFSSLLTAGGNIILTADELDFNGPADSISTTGGGTLLLQPTSNPFAINIGTTAGGSAVSLDLSVSDLLALKDGFSQISIGRAVTGRHVIDIGNATFRDKLLIQSPGPAPSSSITVTGTLNMINNDDVSMDTPGSISGGGLVSGNYFKIIQSGGIGSIATPLQTNVATLEAANSGSGDLVINNAGDVTLINQFRNLASGFELRLSTTNGSINTGTATVASTNGRIILAANDTGAGANITVGSGGITSNGGMIALHAADNITVNGAVSSNSGNIEIIAGASDATFITGLLNGPLTLPATETVVDGNGSISINATVDAGPGAPATRGNIVLISATHDSAPAGTRVPLSTAITQGAGGTLRANNLTAVTLRGTGGQNNGGGSIVLNGATPLNSAANVNLFACAESGCPGPLGGAPFTTAPMIAAIAAPPVGLYADGPLFFTSGTTNISGVGTVNDFVFWGSPVLTVTGGTLFGRKLTFESDGDIIIDLASQITDTNVSMGGVLKFVAGHDINYITPAVETDTFGAAGNPITHGDIQFIASNDIKINNSIYLGNSNTLTLSANQPVSFITPSIALGGPAPNGQPLAASGTGTVTIQAGTATALSDNAAILQAGNVNIGSLLLPVYQLKLLGGTTESLTLTTRQVEHSDAQIKANDALNVFVGAGGLTLAGGTATVTNTATAAAQATANASMESATTTLNVTGNITLNANYANAAGGLAALLNDVGADASAYINSPLSPGSLSAIIGGSLTANGGTAIAGPNQGHALASATVSGGTIAMQVGNGITMQGGSATATVGTGSGSCLSTGGVCATALALISSGTSTLINNSNGDIKFNGGNALVTGGGAGTANAIAGLIDHAPSTLATVMEVSTTGGAIKLTGGNEIIVGSGDAKSTSTIVSGGGIKLSATGGVVLQGAATGIFQSVGSPPTIISLDGTIPPIVVLGGVTYITAAGTGNALISSGAPPSNLDPLAAGLLSSLNTLLSAIKLQGLGSLSTSSGSGKPNYCK